MLAALRSAASSSTLVVVTPSTATWTRRTGSSSRLFICDEGPRAARRARAEGVAKTGAFRRARRQQNLAPTLLDFAGAEPPRDEVDGKAVPRKFDGVSLRPWLTGAAAPPERDSIVVQYYGKQQWVVPIRSIRTRDWKYVIYAGGAEHGDELYDLAHDPGEIVNLAHDAKFAATKADLSARLDRWIEDHHDPFKSLAPAGIAADAGDSER